jgi:predicted RNase H-like HicB family nuclease
MDQLTYRIIIEPDEGAFHVYVPALPGCHSAGRTITMARKNIEEALELYLECLIEHGDPIPSDESFETFHTVGVPRRTRRKTKASSKHYA